MRGARHAGSWLVLWIAVTALYLLLTGVPEAAEVGAGFVAAAVATASVVVVRIQSEADFALRPGWVGLLGRLPVPMLRDSVAVAAAIARALAGRGVAAGRFRTMPFDPGGDDPVSASRRALVIAGVSLPPNAYVVEVDRGAGHLLVHQLVPTPGPLGGGDREWPR